MANTTIIKMMNQLLLHSVGAKNPKMYSITPTMANKLIRDILNASFNCVDDIIHRITPLNKITPLFRKTFVG